MVGAFAVLPELAEHPTAAVTASTTPRAHRSDLLPLASRGFVGRATHDGRPMCTMGELPKNADRTRWFNYLSRGSAMSVTT